MPAAGFLLMSSNIISSALLLLCLLQCVKGNNYLNVGLVNPFFCQKKRAIITPF